MSADPRGIGVIRKGIDVRALFSGKCLLACPVRRAGLPQFSPGPGRAGRRRRRGPRPTSAVTLACAHLLQRRGGRVAPESTRSLSIGQSIPRPVARTVLSIRAVGRRTQVHHRRVVLQRQEGVTQTLRQVDRAPSSVRRAAPSPTARTSESPPGCPPRHRARRRATQVTYLAWLGGNWAKCTPRSTSRRRHRAVGLAQVELVPRHLGEPRFGEPLEKQPARVAVQLGGDLPGAGDREFARGHWPRSAYAPSTASFNGPHQDSLSRYQSMVACRPSSKSVCLGAQPSSSLQGRRIDRVAQIMPGPVGDMVEVVGVAAHQPQQGAHHREVVALALRRRSSRSGRSRPSVRICQTARLWSSTWIQSRTLAPVP